MIMSANDEIPDGYKVTEPNAARLIEALRDTGYSFETAVADLVDNSIAAYATHIRLMFSMNPDGSIQFLIGDNGVGMDSTKLLDAMAYGSSERDDADESLGKFGLGLKTASSSQARKFSVITTNGEDSASASWDLDEVVRIGLWVLKEESEHEEELVDLIHQLPENPDERTNSGSGTIVIWEKIDRVMKDYADPTGSHAKKAFKVIKEDLINHLQMTYMKFIDTEDDSAPNVSISLNGEEVIPWDPFCRWHEKTEELQHHVVEVYESDNSEKIGEISLKAYVIPHISEFETKDEKNLARVGGRSGKGATKYQGMYVYRQNRLLAPHEWFRLRSREPHVNNLRIEVEFGPELDENLQLDFKKTRILFDPNIKAYLKDEWLPPIGREAERIYRDKGGGSGGNGAGTDGIHNDSGSMITDVQVDNLQITLPLDVELDARNDVEIQNPSGRHRVQVHVASPQTDIVTERVQAVDNIRGDMLFQPILINGEKGVQLNKGHEFYQKLYYPNANNRNLILALDGLFWSLCVAEFKAIPHTDSARWFQNMRWEITRLLEEYALGLPHLNLDAEEVEEND